jgi:segregation and condensation protein B
MNIELKNIVEALLFTAERPLTPKDIRGILSKAVDEENPAMTQAFRGIRDAAIGVVLEELKVEYDTGGRGFHLQELASGWRLVSRPEFAPWLHQLFDETRPHRLSQPALETLSIIALRQPISRADVAAIRGVEVDGVMKSLLERDLITITGRSEAPGKPMLYGTTPKFLEHFGLLSLDDMPKAAELRQQAAALKTAEQQTEQSQQPSESATSDTAQPASEPTGQAETEPESSPDAVAPLTETSPEPGSTDEQQTRQTPQQD